MLLFKRARRGAAVAIADVAVITPLGRFQEAVPAERRSEDFRFILAVLRASVAATPIAVVADFAGIDAAIAALCADTVGGRSTGIGAGAGHGNTGIDLANRVGCGTAAECLVAGVLAGAGYRNASVFIADGVRGRAAPELRIAVISSFAGKKHARLILACVVPAVGRGLGGGGGGGGGR